MITNKGQSAERYHYNKLGQLTLVTNLQTGTNLLDNPDAITSGTWLNSVQYQYDELNRVAKTSSYFGHGSVYSYQEHNDGGSPGDERDDTHYQYSYDYSGSLERVQYTSYDGDGRVTNVDDWGISTASALQEEKGSELIIVKAFARY